VEELEVEAEVEAEAEGAEVVIRTTSPGKPTYPERGAPA
jgi:hypothetical protein